jgi:NTP pyrophosphatase (non-canonical NTP hydrolase)
MGVLKDIQEIGAVNRSPATVERRVLKATEEVGELAEAVLSATSASNAKGKTWMNIVDEACDVAIMGIDIAMTKPPGQESIDDAVWRDIVKNIFALKLKKWQTQVKSGRTLIPISELPVPPVEDAETLQYVNHGNASRTEELRFGDGNPTEGCGQIMGHGVVCGQGMLCIKCAPELHKTSG